MKTNEEIINSLLKVDDDFEITMTGKQFREIHKATITDIQREMVEKVKDIIENQGAWENRLIIKHILLDKIDSLQSPAKEEEEG